MFVNFFWIIMIIIIIKNRVIITGEPHACLLAFLNYYDYNWKCRVHAYRIKTMAPHVPWKDASSCALVLAMLNMLYSSMNQQLLEKNKAPLRLKQYRVVKK